MVNRIGLLNFQHSNHNYGAVLQAAALEYQIGQLGLVVEHIDFRPPSDSSLKRLIKLILRKLNLYNQATRQNSKGIEVFERFRERFITRSPMVTNAKAFERVSHRYRIVVVGSDQVWRPSMTWDPEAFFLAYVPKKVQKLAYAASFGVADWEYSQEDSITLMARNALSEFSAISCRELSGLRICKEHFNLDAKHVLDPVLLVEETFFQSIMSEVTSSAAKLVYYKLDYDEGFSKAIKQFERKYGCEAHNLYQPNDFEQVDQWLRKIYDSEVVITDSFHCVCLGIRFGKEVFYVPNVNRGQTRMDSLFETLGISKMRLDQVEIEIYSLKPKPGLDIDLVLKNYRTESIGFLENSLLANT